MNSYYCPRCGQLLEPFRFKGLLTEQQWPNYYICPQKDLWLVTHSLDNKSGKYLVTAEQRD